MVLQVKVFKMKALKILHIHKMTFCHPRFLYCFPGHTVIIADDSVVWIQSLSLSQMKSLFSRQSVTIVGRFFPVSGSAERSNAIKQVRNIGEYLEKSVNCVALTSFES